MTKTYFCPYCTCKSYICGNYFVAPLVTVKCDTCQMSFYVDPSFEMEVKEELIKSDIVEQVTPKEPVVEVEIPTLGQEVRKFDVDNVDLEITDIEFWPEGDRNKGGFEICWTSKIGFGTCIIYKDNKGTLKVDSECMDVQEDKAFTAKLLSILLEKLIVEG